MLPVRTSVDLAQTLVDPARHSTASPASASLKAAFRKSWSCSLAMHCPIDAFMRALTIASAATGCSAPQGARQVLIVAAARRRTMPPTRPHLRYGRQFTLNSIPTARPSAFESQFGCTTSSARGRTRGFLAVTSSRTFSPGLGRKTRPVSAALAEFGTEPAAVSSRRPRPLDPVTSRLSEAHDRTVCG